MAKKPNFVKFYSKVIDIAKDLQIKPIKIIHERLYHALENHRDTKGLLNLNLHLDWSTWISGLIYENSIIKKNSHLQWEPLGHLLGI